MTEEKPKRQRKKKQPEKKRLDEQQIVGLGDIFPGFASWYRASYDAEGNLKPSGQMPGLGPVKKREEEEQ